MKWHARWTIALALIAGACLNGAARSEAASSEEADVTLDYEAQQKAAAEARAKDPAWKPACEEVGLIQIGNSKKAGALRNFCLNAEGNILACFAPNESTKPGETKNAPGIRVYSPKGELLKTWPLEIKPSAICVAKDGSVYVAGDGRVLKLDAAGRVVASAASPVADVPVTITKEIEEMLKESGRPLKEEKQRMLTSLERRRLDVTGLAVTEQDVFMAVPTPNEFTYRVYRFDHALGNLTLVVEKLRGCCGQMDIQSHDGRLWIPHNARHQVEARDRDGKELLKFGRAGRVKPDDFGGCCEPKCLRILPNGEILAAESGPPTCIKRFSASGKFLGMVALVNDSKGDCVRVTVATNTDGSRYYLLDTTRDAIRVFGRKS